MPTVETVRGPVDTADLGPTLMHEARVRAVDAQAAVAQIAPNWNSTHISNDVLPALRERGVSEEQVRQMLVEAPRRYFER